MNKVLSAPIRHRPKELSFDFRPARIRRSSQTEMVF
jgi:hypothetical protein